MGIPRFYRWQGFAIDTLKQEWIFRIRISNFQLLIIFILISMDQSTDVQEQEGIYVFQEFQCFLKNKFDPLTQEQIFNKVYQYLLTIIETVNPQKMIYIAFDGVAPRAKINQSRDRRFKAGKQKKQFRQFLSRIQLQDKQIFQQNSISPGTEFLTNMCERLKKSILQFLENQWKGLDIIYSDCLNPGEGEHKIMEFLRESKKIGIFNQDATHCIYSADADVLLLSLATEIKNIVLIREDSLKNSYGFTARCYPRKYPQPQFQYVFLNILRQYLAKQFQQCMKQLKMNDVQPIINDFILLMAFVGNDFLPLQFCFAIKETHMEALFNNYKSYLMKSKVFINKKGLIDWDNITKLLEISKQFEASMLEEMMRNKKSNLNGRRTKIEKQKNKQQQQKIESDEGKDEEQVANFEVQDKKIVKGRQYYYKSRFGIQNFEKDPKFQSIIQNYIQGLQFYCQYYFNGVPSWNWHYQYHYTPLLTDLYDHICHNKVQANLIKSQPYDPFMALIMMMPLESFNLFPKIIKQVLEDKQNEDFIKEYFPQKFKIDAYQPIKYNRRALIKFLPGDKVKEIYQKIDLKQYSAIQQKRNQRSNTILFRNKGNKIQGEPIVFGNKKIQQNLIKSLSSHKKKTKKQKLRFPSLDKFGDFDIDEKGRICTKRKYKYTGPQQLVQFNHFLGYVQDVQKCPEDLSSQFQQAYDKYGISSKCIDYYCVKQVHPVRQNLYLKYMKTNREVYVPDFALFKAPKLEYFPEIGNIQPADIYKLGQKIVVIGNSKYFGYIGSIQKMNDKKATIKLNEPSYSINSKIQQNQEQFYTLQSVAKKMAISQELILIILDQILILPKSSRSLDPDIFPLSVNFGLNVINRQTGCLCPYYARCQMQYQNTSKRSQIFNKLEISQSCLRILKIYSQKFQYLIDYIETMLENDKKFDPKSIKASSLFQQPTNESMYKQFLKLYEIQIPGYFCSIYSKVANKEYLDYKFQPKQRVEIEIQLPYSDFISKNQARISPPGLRIQPEFHDLGDRIIFLKTLESGHIVGIDDNNLYITVKSRKMNSKINNVIKCNFMEVFNQKWINYLLKSQGKLWPINISYYTPTHYTTAL